MSSTSSSFTYSGAVSRSPLINSRGNGGKFGGEMRGRAVVRAADTFTAVMVPFGWGIELMCKTVDDEIIW